jgi:hypothetical protein
MYLRTCVYKFAERCCWLTGPVLVGSGSATQQTSDLVLESTTQDANLVREVELGKASVLLMLLCSLLLSLRLTVLLL